MSPSIARHCPECQQYQDIPLSISNDPEPRIEPEKLLCPECNAEWGKIQNHSDIFDYCPVCQCRQFYTMKTFNQMVGCSIMLVAILLVPKTYGLSLPIFSLIDWLLYKRSKDMIVCYKCACEFKGFDDTQRFKPFKHHIGLKYDKYR